MENLVKQYTEMLHKKEEAERYLAEAREILARTEEAQRVDVATQKLAEIEKEIDTLRALIEQEAKAAYKSTGCKHPHPAVTVRERKKPVYDEDKFKQWAIEHGLPKLLKLNKSAANKVALGPAAPEFVEIKSVLSIAIKVKE